ITISNIFLFFRTSINLPINNTIIFVLLKKCVIAKLCYNSNFIYMDHCLKVSLSFNNLFASHFNPYNIFLNLRIRVYTHNSICVFVKLYFCVIILFNCEGGIKVTKVITFGNFKGGVGKTTATAMFAYLLANQNKKTLAIDFDPQANMTNFLFKSSDVTLDKGY